MASTPGFSSLSLPQLKDNNFDAWRQSLWLIASAMSANGFLEKSIDPKSLNDEPKKNFYILANLMLNSLSERPRAIAIASGMPRDIVPDKMYERLAKFYTPSATFNDLAYRREFFLLRYDNFGAIDLLAAAIERIAAKINEIDENKAKKYQTIPSKISERDKG